MSPLNQLRVIRASYNNFTSVMLRDTSMGHNMAVTEIQLNNNNLQGQILDLTWAQQTLLFLQLSGNPDMVNNCNTTGFASYQCLPSYLTLDSSSTVFPDGMDGVVCMDIISDLGKSQTVEIDSTALNYANCYCDTGYVQQRSNENITCLSCSAHSQCQCYYGRMRGCYPTPFNNNNGNSTKWTAVMPCPVIGLADYACTNASDSSLPPPWVGDVPLPVFACAEGYTDRLCTRCEENWYSSGYACSLCPSYLGKLLIPLFIIVLIVLIVYVLKVPPGSSAVLKIVMFYLQTTLVLVNSAGVGWPISITATAEHVSSAASFSVSALECVFPGISIVGKFIFYVCIPIGLIAVVFLLFIVGRIILRVRHASSPQHELWQSRCISVGLFLLNMVFFGVSVKMLSAFGCTLHDDGDGQTYLNVHPWVACSRSSLSSSLGYPYSAMLAIGLIGFFAYVFGIPVMSAMLLYRSRHDLGSAQAIVRYGYLYACYRQETRFWEAIFTLRRLLLSVVLVAVPFSSPQTAVLLVFAILQVAIVLQHVFAPFKTRLENVLELCSLYVLLGSFLAAYAARESSLTDNYDPTGLLYVVLIVNIIFALILAFIALAVYAAFAMSKLSLLRKYVNVPALERIENTGIMLQEMLLGPGTYTE